MVGSLCYCVSTDCHCESPLISSDDDDGRWWWVCFRATATDSKRDDKGWPLHNFVKPSVLSTSECARHATLDGAYVHMYGCTMCDAGGVCNGRE